ncbi:hypothetical protein KIN20_017432 [Parelaphostrongylus tenuis]|uniref:Uncharacterized protein n=1 Tax=Parelaphostrongylus tenuis TaxID=148309 RepID=A0AAD5N339_PARTN|nr:hypothetical protein KIN20_017432 [Parelaphostrongylus tenuis]
MRMGFVAQLKHLYRMLKTWIVNINVLSDTRREWKRATLLKSTDLKPAIVYRTVKRFKETGGIDEKIV